MTVVKLFRSLKISSLPLILPFRNNKGFHKSSSTVDLMNWKGRYNLNKSRGEYIEVELAGIIVYYICEIDRQQTNTSIFDENEWINF